MALRHFCNAPAQVLSNHCTVYCAGLAKATRLQECIFTFGPSQVLWVSQRALGCQAVSNR